MEVAGDPGRRYVVDRAEQLPQGGLWQDEGRMPQNLCRQILIHYE